MATIHPPILRQDLAVYPSEPDVDGIAIWILHDPLANRYFHLGQHEIELLQILSSIQYSESLVDDVSRHLGRSVNMDELVEMFEFLRRNNLVLGDIDQQNLYQKQVAKNRGQNGWLSMLARSYLFIRVPLWNPDRFLTKTLPYVRWLGSRNILVLLSVLLFVSLFLVLQQVDVFFKTFLHFYSFEGIIAAALTLIFIKVIHELGHAYVAKSFGCHVPVIGVAFLVGWPVLYTDTSDAWKLSSRKKRMMISASGITVEIAVAIICLFLWNFMQDGILRSIVFFLASTTWLASLLVNINPLMRFDGYYFFSDYINIPNLEFRSFALAKWWLRECLFGTGRLPPEPIRIKLIIFAICVWIYRFLLFLGIAILVYNFFFKLAGIILFAAEIIYFIIMPISREIREWWKLRDELKLNFNTVRTITVIVLFIFLGLIPWSRTVTIPATYHHAYSEIYNPVAGRIKNIHVKNGSYVEEGQILVEMDAPELMQEHALTMMKYEELKQRRSSLGFDPVQRSDAMVISAELESQYQLLQSLNAEIEKLVIRAPHHGVIVDSRDGIDSGNWISDGVVLFAIVDNEVPEITGYVYEDSIQRLSPNQKGKFYPDRGHWSDFKVEVSDIELIGLVTVDSPYHASFYGGEVPVRKQSDGRLLPVKGIYRAFLRPSGEVYVPDRVVRGIIKINASKESFFIRFLRLVISQLRKESGF